MRGALVAGRQSRFGQRIIPADAGSTARPCCCHASGQDHPRRCGEHSIVSPECMSINGSSPQMRGALIMYIRSDLTSRIIPADAGSTFPLGYPDFTHEDHPRRCGEHLYDTGSQIINGGSSPQMRGAPPQHLPHKLKIRIIPADAGSTACLAWSFAMTEDHPRRCGEHYHTAPSSE